MNFGLVFLSLLIPQRLLIKEFNSTSSVWFLNWEDFFTAFVGSTSARTANASCFMGLFFETVYADSINIQEAM